MILRYDARGSNSHIKPRGDGSNLGSSTTSFSGSKHLGLILGLCLGILIPLTIVVVIVWRWKARNIREKKRSDSKRPSDKGSKGSEKSDPTHNVSSNSNPPRPPPNNYHVPPSSFSHTASGPSRNPQGYPTRPSGGYSRPISADQSTLVATPPADAQRGPRLAPRDARRSSADMGDLIEMLNSQRIDPSGKPAHRKGRPSIDDPLKEEPYTSFLPTTNDSNASLGGDINKAPRIPSVPGVSPLDMPTPSHNEIPPPMPMPIPRPYAPAADIPPPSMPMPVHIPDNITAQTQAFVSDIPSPPSMSMPIPDNITTQPQTPKPAKPKPSTVARGISATPAVYAPVTRSRSTDSRRMQSPIMPRDPQLGGTSPPASFEGSSPLQQVEALREARAKATTDSEWY